MSMRPWQQFVIDHGAKVPVDDLSHILGVPAQEITALRNRGVCKPARGERPSFAELVQLWWGRPAVDGDWPAPKKVGARRAYAWLAPEYALLGRLVGQISGAEIAAVLTRRLRHITGDPAAGRTRMAVQAAMQRLGLVASDVVGGLSVRQAASECGSIYAVYQAIERGDLRARRAGSRLVVDRESWAAFKATRVPPPDGFVALASIRAQLGIRSDKLSEFARAGHIPTAIRCNPFGTDQKTTRFGTWYISEETAKRLVADRRTGKPMPWHGKPLADNLRATWRLFDKRRHPRECRDCAVIWGAAGAPTTFEDYCSRYPGLAHGAKRHLTRVWSPGVTVKDAARRAKVSVAAVRTAIENSALTAVHFRGGTYIQKVALARWIARRCPAGDTAQSWLSIEEAKRVYGFTDADIQAATASGRLPQRTATRGKWAGRRIVGRNACAELRASLGYDINEAARRAKVTVPEMETLLANLDWREPGRIPLIVVQNVIKRRQSVCGLTLEQAAEACGRSVTWVREQINAGVVRVLRAPWDRRRLYLTATMLDRLREAAKGPVNQRERVDASRWCSQARAALIAGVSVTTVRRWMADKEVASRPAAMGTLVGVASLKERARFYWAIARAKRQQPPAWVQREFAAHCVDRISGSRAAMAVPA